MSPKKQRPHAGPFDRKPRPASNRPLPPRPAPKKPAAAKPFLGPKTDWGNVAEWYDRLVGEGGSEYQREVVFPGVLRLLAPQQGETIVDVACGQGALCRLLHERRVRAVGVDAAPALVKAARERSGPEDTYFVGDARNLSFLPADRFDAAACVLAIQNMHPIRPVFENVRRVLRPGGRFVMVMMHPCFRGPKETAWVWDPSDRVQFRRVDRYLQPRKSPIVTHPGSAPDVYTWSFHKPIEAYAKGLRQAGMVIDAIEEWPSHKTSAPGPRAAAENRARQEIPMFMAIRAMRLDLPGLAGEAENGQAPE
jgi:ubiquinone/menaquinone biosynthesis C-methylase UbiE